MVEYCQEEKHNWNNIGADFDAVVQKVKYAEVVIDSCSICNATLLTCYLELMKNDKDVEADAVFIMDEDCKEIIQ